MIKTALKHWIYEVCIDQLFAGIMRNFKSFQGGSKDFKVGDIFHYIVTTSNGPSGESLGFVEYGECVITGVNKFGISFYSRMSEYYSRSSYTKDEPWAVCQWAHKQFDRDGHSPPLFIFHRYVYDFEKKYTK